MTALAGAGDELRPAPDRTWVSRAACGDLPVSMMKLFLPDTGDARQNYALTAQAKSYCATCPVVAECLAYALAQGINVGVWGNTTARARRDMVAGPGGDAGLGDEDDESGED